MAKTTLPRNPASSTTAHGSDLAVTGSTLTGRAALALFSRYVRNTGIFVHLERLFGGFRWGRIWVFRYLLRQLFLWRLE